MNCRNLEKAIQLMTLCDDLDIQTNHLFKVAVHKAGKENDLYMYNLTIVNCGMEKWVWFANISTVLLCLKSDTSNQRNKS